MLARKRSLVSWMVVCSTTFSFHRLARIEATAGLQISQPCPGRGWISSSNDLIRLILTISNSSCARAGEMLAQVVVDLLARRP